MVARRTSLYFPREALSALEAIRKRTRKENGADVIRLAVLTYSRILEFIDQGSKIVVRDQKDQEFNYSPYRPFKYPGIETECERSEIDETVSGKNFFFSGEIIEQLDQIRARGYVYTNSDAVRAALAAYKELIAVVAAGDEIIIRQRGGQAFLFEPDAPYAPQAPCRKSEPRLIGAEP